jgi:hypothetical protein
MSTLTSSKFRQSRSEQSNLFQHAPKATSTIPKQTTQTKHTTDPGLTVEEREDGSLRRRRPLPKDTSRRNFPNTFRNTELTLLTPTPEKVVGYVTKNSIWGNRVQRGTHLRLVELKHHVTLRCKNHIIFLRSVRRLLVTANVVPMKNGVIWDVMLCGSCKNRSFGGT